MDPEFLLLLSITSKPHEYWHPPGSFKKDNSIHFYLLIKLFLQMYTQLLQYSYQNRHLGKPKQLILIISYNFFFNFAIQVEKTSTLLYWILKSLFRLFLFQNFVIFSRRFWTLNWEFSGLNNPWKNIPHQKRQSTQHYQQWLTFIFMNKIFTPFSWHLWHLTPHLSWVRRKPLRNWLLIFLPLLEHRITGYGWIH